jgi:RimJ/RimL family protein N-acetyltransferase
LLTVKVVSGNHRSIKIMIELDRADYDKARLLFEPLAYHLTSAAVLDGNSPGKVFVDDPACPQTAFMFSPEGCYLAGDPGNDAFNRALNGAIYTGEVLDAGVEALFFVCHPESWVRQLAVVLAPRQPIEMPRRHYVCRGLKIDWRASVPDGYAVRRINAELLKDAGLKIPAHVWSWMENNWGSPASFLEKGFGFVGRTDGRTINVRNVRTMYSGEVVSWSLADCVSGDACEIGIHTARPFRRRGLATITAAAAVDYALSHGFSAVGWQCPEDNLGSIGTAEKVGFERERDYTMYYAFLDEAEHLAETGYVAFKAGRYGETADLYERVFAMWSDSPDYLYHLAARAWAALGDHDKALKYLGVAAERNWSDIERTWECQEFRDLHDTQEWAVVLERMQQNRSDSYV